MQWKCLDCGDTEFEMFMVKDSVWKKIWPTYVEEMLKIKSLKKRHGVLCIPCCEKRLGRKLTDRDMLYDADWVDPAGVLDYWL